MRTIILSTSLAILIAHSTIAQESAVAKQDYVGVSRVKLLNYPDCIQLTNGSTRVVLGHHVGGRLLVYERDGKNVIYLSPEESQWSPAESNNKKPTSAGRFDVGPELLQARGDTIWSGGWTAEETGPRQARMISLIDPKSGLQVTRDFKLDAGSSRLTITQTVENKGDRVVRQCYWSRTFAVHGGVAVIPCDASISRFPNLYYMGIDLYTANFGPEDPAIRRIDDFLLVDRPPEHAKLGMDSVKGWAAYQTRQDQLFVKRFPVFPERVYAEATGINFSLWYPKADLCEIEPIGPMETLQPGDATSFTVDWWLLSRPWPKSGIVDPHSVAHDVELQCPSE